MAHLEIPIPDDVPEQQRAALTGLLTEVAHQHIAARLPCQDDPEWQAEATRRIKRGMKEFDEGKVMPFRETMRRIADPRRLPSAHD